MTNTMAETMLTIQDTCITITMYDHNHLCVWLCKAGIVLREGKIILKQ